MTAWRSESVQPGQAPRLGAALLRYPLSSAVLVLLVVLVSGLVGFVTGNDHAATARVELTTPSTDSLLVPGSASDAVVTRYTAQRAAFATSDPVLQVVAERTGASVPELRRAVSVTSAEGSNTLVVTADAGSAGRSVTVADAVVVAYGELARAQVDQLTEAALTAIDLGADELRDRLAESPDGAAAQSAATTLSGLEQQANALSTERAVFDDGVQFVEAAVPATGPVVPLRELALGLVVGLGAAAVAAWLRADRDRRVEDGASAAAALDAPLLGEVPAVDDLDDGQQSLRTLPSAPYRPVVPALSLRASTGVVLVTSAAAGEGRTQTALNLATAAARDGLRVLLVDADPLGARLSWICGAGRDMVGVSSLVAPGPVTFTAQLTGTIALGAGAAVALLPSGRASGARDVQLPRAAQFVEAVRDAYDLVVIDAAPLPTGGLPAVLARLADQVLVVVRHGAPLDDALRLHELLSLYGTPVVGVLLTFAHARHAAAHER